MRGFTLLELLVVLLLMGLALGLLVPRLERALSPPARPFPEALADLLQRARKRALFTGQDLLLVIDPETRHVLLFEAPLASTARALEQLPIPEQYEVKQQGLAEVEGQVAVLFLADGTSSGGEIELVDREQARRELLRLPRALVWVERKPLSP